MSLYSSFYHTRCKTAAVAAPLLLTSVLVMYEAGLHGCGTSPVCLLCAIATVFQLYHDGGMMNEMSRRKPESTLLPTEGLFNLPHHIGMVWEELAFDNTISFTQWGDGLQHG